MATYKKNYPSVTITFPIFNGGKEPLECLSSIYKLNYPMNKIEVIVIDNNSTDGSDIQIKQKFPQVKLIKMKENTGFAKGVNTGIKKSIGEYIFIGNDDIIFERNSLKNMVKYMEMHPEVGITGGKIFLKSKPKKLISCGFMMNNWNGNIFQAKYPNKIIEPDRIQGCAMLLPKKMLNKIGLLDEGFSLIYFEDFDLCLRAKKAGYKVKYLPTAIFLHGETTTMNKYTSFKYYFWYKNKIRFTLKNMPLINILTILLIQLFFIAPLRAIVYRDGRLFPLLKGFWWNIIHLTQTLSKRSSSFYINK